MVSLVISAGNFSQNVHLMLIQNVTFSAEWSVYPGLVVVVAHLPGAPIGWREMSRGKSTSDSSRNTTSNRDAFSRYTMLISNIHITHKHVYKLLNISIILYICLVEGYLKFVLWHWILLYLDNFTLHVISNIAW